MEDRLGHAPEEQADAEAGGDQHRVPRRRGELRAGVGSPEPDLAVAAEREEQRRSDEDVEIEDVHPAECSVDEVENRFEDAGCGIREYQRQEDEDQQESRRPERHLRMDVEAHAHDVAVPGLPVGHLRVEVDVGIDLQTFEHLAIVDRVLAATLLLLLPVVQGEGRLGQVDVGVVRAAADPRVCPRALVLGGHNRPLAVACSMLGDVEHT